MQMLLVGSELKTMYGLNEGIKMNKVSKELGNFSNKTIKKIVMLAITHC
jgi:hypothetical protein